MILKIQRYKEDTAYWLLDGVKKISVSEPLKYRTREERGNIGLHDSEFLDLLKCTCVETENSRDCCSDCVDHDEYVVRRLVCRLESGDDYLILFDTIVYILNDQGKTIEKIVANYKDNKKI